MDQPKVLRVLVVDDDHAIADDLSRLIRGWGYACETAYAGAEALEKARSFNPNVAILDLVLPDVDGAVLAQQLIDEAQAKDITLIAISGYVAEGQRRFASGRFEDYFLKPVELEDLARVLQAEQSRRAG